jgi:hypothetical protein
MIDYWLGVSQNTVASVLGSAAVAAWHWRRVKAHVRAEVAKLRGGKS